MIVYLETVEIQLRDIPRVLCDLGYDVKTVDLKIKAQEFSEDKCKEIIAVLKRENAECAISYDFSQTISQACLEADIPYIAWVYDDPQQELYTRQAHYPNNYIFVFDGKQQKRLIQTGLRNVYHMPLAIYGEKVRNALKQGDMFEGKYNAEIAFVGQLYRIESLENIIRQSDADIQAAIEKTIAGCFLNWNQSKMHGTMENNCVRYFSEVDGHKIGRDYPYMSEQFYYEAAVLSRLIANRERVTILNDLADRYDVRYYTFDKEVKGLSSKVKVCPGAKYDTEVSHVYHQSKINLNITLHCIETGISQRVFDVMAAGGFLMSNYQAELEELFAPGEDLVIYHDLEELRSLTAYYLEHEEERKRIARNGQDKVLKYHDLRIRMQQVMELVRKKEQERTEAYADILSKQEPEIEMMRELALCANIESKLGTCKLWTGIEQIEDAVDKYFEARKILFRILAMNRGAGEVIDSPKYDKLCELICEKKIPSLYIVWQIYEKDDTIKESTLLAVCEAMKKHHMVQAIELVSYGLLMEPYATNLLLKKAECFMDIAMWKEALDTLKEIREPADDIVCLIQELENALNS